MSGKRRNIMTISKSEAEKILNDYKVAEELERKKAQTEEAAKVAKGWQNCTWIVTKTTRQLFMSKEILTGWNVKKCNIYNNEIQGMFYYVTYQKVLLHDGGGTYVLRDGIVITDQDIQDINNGKIPDILSMRKVNPQTGKEL
jgi:hypothetical protein